MSEQANIDAVQGIYDAFSRGDVPGVLGRLDQGAELAFEAPSSVPWAGQWRGTDGWTKFFQTLATHLDGITVKMQPFAAQGDRVVFAGRYTAKVKATGKAIDSPLVHLWTVRNGKALKCQEMANTAAEVAACGA
jgi:ketosteroid isomerase-like protein